MNMLGHRLGILGGTILLAIVPAQSNGAPAAVMPPGGLVRAPGLVRTSMWQDATMRFPAEAAVLVSIESLGKEPVALLSVKRPNPPSRLTALDVGLELGHWLAAGDSFFGYTVKAIAKDHMILVRSDTAAEIKIPLASPPATTGEPKPYSKAWINSRANPMLNNAQGIPGRMYDGEWDKLTTRQKALILEFYRKHGWQLIPSKPGPGPTEFKWRNLYEAERAAAIEANRERFERTLTPEQLGLWKQMRGFKIIYFERGRVGPTDEQKELIAAQKRIIDDFSKSLTAEQKAEQEGIWDFTKASWK